MKLHVDRQDSMPLYRQICDQIHAQIREGILLPGQMLPSLNQLAIALDISRETTKKAYNRLLRERVLIARQGKGVFVAGRRSSGRKEILVILDKQSVYNQVMMRSFGETLGEDANLTIVLHNQHLDVLEYHLDQHLDRYDHYVVSPHFPLDAQSRLRAGKLLKRIPNHKLIMVDHWLREVPGNYGVVFQDFRHDAFDGLAQGREDLLHGGVLKVIVLPQSLYGKVILEGVREFAEQNNLAFSCYNTVPDRLEKGDVVLVLNSQLDSGLALLAHHISDCGLVPGQDVRIISYNDFPLNEVVLGGLTTLSTDFPAMGRTAAEMILSGIPAKVHNPFRLVRRRTF